MPVMFTNHYVCPSCAYVWQDEWSSTVDDDCPACGERHIEPDESHQFVLDEAAADDGPLAEAEWLQREHDQPPTAYERLRAAWRDFIDGVAEAFRITPMLDWLARTLDRKEPPASIPWPSNPFRFAYGSLRDPNTGEEFHRFALPEAMGIGDTLMMHDFVLHVGAVKYTFVQRGNPQRIELTEERADGNAVKIWPKDWGRETWLTDIEPPRFIEMSHQVAMAEGPIKPGDVVSLNPNGTFSATLRTDRGNDRRDLIHILTLLRAASREAGLLKLPCPALEHEIDNAISVAQRRVENIWNIEP